MNLHEIIQVDEQLSIQAFYAGHVLGAVMFLVKVGEESVPFLLCISLVDGILALHIEGVERVFCSNERIFSSNEIFSYKSFSPCPPPSCNIIHDFYFRFFIRVTLI